MTGAAPWQCWRGCVANSIGRDVRAVICRCSGNRVSFASSSADSVAANARCRFHDRLAKSGADFVTSAALSGTDFAARGGFSMSGTDDFVAGASLSQGQVQISRQEKAQRELLDR